MPNIFDMVNAKEIAAYWTNTVDSRVPYLGATLMPARKQLGLDLKWIRGGNGLPAMLVPSAFDATATLRDRIGLKAIETEMPFFREAMRIGEKDRQELNKAAAAANADFILPVIERIYDDATGLIESAEVTVERMRMQLLSTGKIAVSANRIDYEYDYRFPAEHLIELTDPAELWSATETARPIEDIQAWQQTVEDNSGIKPSRAICSGKTWAYLLMNKSIRLDLNPIGGQNLIMTDSILQQYLLSKLGLTVAVYSKKFSLNGVPTAFFPDDTFTLIPDGVLGRTWYGTTPEESDLMSGSTEAQVQIVNTGVAVTTIKDPHPVNIQTIVSEIVLPSFEQIGSTLIAKVA